MELVNRWKGIKESPSFKNIAIVGRNPFLYLKNLPKNQIIQNLYICDTTEESVDRSFSQIQGLIDSGMLFPNL